MNIVYSEKKWIVYIQGRNNSVYSGKKWIVLIQGWRNVFIHSALVYTGKKLIVPI